jgi:cell division protein FtsI (penicillin-binding protein 3)
LIKEWRRAEETVLGWGRGVESERTREGSYPATRLIALAVLAVLWALAVFGRLVHLQVVSHKTYQEQAERQQQRTLRVDAPRGTIFDRSGHVLAMSVPADSVSINPMRVPDRPLAAALLERVLRIDGRDMLEKMNRAVEEHRRAIQENRKPRGTGFLWVKRKITPAESEALRSLKLDWVEFQKESHRYYPDGSLASHVVGTVDFQERGNLGLEQKLDSELGGRPGQVTMLQDVLQRGIESEVSAAAEPGRNITLAIDERIQFVVERELRAAGELRHAASGSAVVMNPQTGEILALASYPAFDPEASGQPASARFDYPVSVAFEPGSVFKIVTLSAALETTHLRPESMINCGNGAFTLFGRTIHESHHGLGTISMADVLAKSSNVGAIQIGLKVGDRNLLDYVRRFGFGQRTGIPLPAEDKGMVRDLRLWGKTSIASVSMGHEVSATALQLAQACSVIANGGVLVRPRLILSRQRPGEKPVAEPMAPPKRVVRPETAITMRQMMEGVVLHGTGKGARLTGYTAGGKTGTAQIFDTTTKRYTKMYNGSFVGFAPVTNPAVVIAVTLNGVKDFGAIVAGPVFKSVGQETLRLLGVPKDIPDVEPDPVTNPEELNDLADSGTSQPPEDLAQLPQAPPLPQAVQPLPDGRGSATGSRGPVTDGRGSVTGGRGPATDVRGSGQAQGVVTASGPAVPSFQGKSVRAVLEQSLAAGIPVDVIGSGVARQQAPAAGSYLNRGERVRVQFQ